jgi:hypothetical protein
MFLIKILVAVLALVCMLVKKMVVGYYVVDVVGWSEIVSTVFVVVCMMVKKMMTVGKIGYYVGDMFDLFEIVLNDFVVVVEIEINNYFLSEIEMEFVEEKTLDIDVVVMVLLYFDKSEEENITFVVDFEMGVDNENHLRLFVVVVQ